MVTPLVDVFVRYEIDNNLREVEVHGNLLYDALLNHKSGIKSRNRFFQIFFISWPILKLRLQ